MTPVTNLGASNDDATDDTAQLAPLALTFDDVLLLPGETDVIPSEVDTTSRLTREISVAVPLLSAAMDTVTEARMAIAMAREGGIGVLHRNLSIEDQAHQVDLVKRSEAGMVNDPVTIAPDATLAELDALCGTYRVSGLPVVDEDRRLLGIITNRDLLFVPAEDFASRTVRELMTPMPLVTAPVGISSADAAALLAKHKIEKLPLLDAAGRLAGLITVKDFVKTEKHPLATKDGESRLRVAAAIGFFGDSWERATALVEAGVDVHRARHGQRAGPADARHGPAAQGRSGDPARAGARRQRRDPGRRAGSGRRRCRRRQGRGRTGLPGRRHPGADGRRDVQEHRGRRRRRPRYQHERRAGHRRQGLVHRRAGGDGSAAHAVRTGHGRHTGPPLLAG